MLSKAKIKYLSSLKKKKFRQKYNKFLVEGDKITREIIQDENINIHSIYGLRSWFRSNRKDYPSIKKKYVEIDSKELNLISSLTSPNQVVVEAEIPGNIIRKEEVRSNLCFALDGIRDPGNLGTILRIADWFGIPFIFCSPDCADLFNPKVLQASMGAFLRVKCMVIELEELFSTFIDHPIIGAVLDGQNLFSADIPKKGFLLIGNESRGISKDLLTQVQYKVTIPGPGNGAESLNAAVACGILTAVIKNEKGLML